MFGTRVKSLPPAQLVPVINPARYEPPPTPLLGVHVDERGQKWGKWLPWSHFRHLPRAREKSPVVATRSGVAHILYPSGCTVSFVRSATVMTSRRRGQNAKSHRRAFSKAIFLLSRFSAQARFGKSDLGYLRLKAALWPLAFPVCR